MLRISGARARVSRSGCSRVAITRGVSIFATSSRPFSGRVSLLPPLFFRMRYNTS